MTGFSLALQERHQIQLRNHFFEAGGRAERAAFVLFGQSEVKSQDSKKIISCFSKEVFLLDDAHTASSSHQHITWSNDLIVPLLKRAARGNLIVGIAHSHIDYPAVFSSQDDDGEAGLLELIQHRNGESSPLISLVFSSLGTFNARIWQAQSSPDFFEKFRVVGDRYVYSSSREVGGESPELARQALAFGEHLNKTIASLEISILGCGGTGSAVAMLLARLGAKRFTLIDPDVVEITNLNRLHGARHEDALHRRAKVEVVSRHIREIAPEAKVNVFQASAVDTRCRDTLKSSDLIFGCTDDNLGRMLINRLAYFYLVPVIDLGLAIEVSRTPPFKVLALDGRVSCIGPGETCLLCRGIISTRLASEEALKSANPAEYERQKEEAYVIGEGNPSPSVVTFTTEVATMAVNELIHRLQGFRGPEGSTSSRTRLFHRMHDLRPGDLPREDCPVCGNDFYWGIGDVVPFLDQVW
jgi:molybdopterin/thiamine biosynthesis adenylyltransferase